MRYFTAWLLTLLFPALAGATNFSYSYLDFSLAHTDLDEKLEVDEERFEELGELRLDGSAQVGDNFALGLERSFATNSRRDERIIESRWGFNAAFPFAVSDALDLVPRFGYEFVQQERCVDRVCEKSSDSAMIYGLDLRTWVVPERFEAFAGWQDSTVEDSETVASVGAALWWLEGNRLSVEVAEDGIDRTFRLGYRYTWH